MYIYMYIPLTLSRRDGNDWSNSKRHHTRRIKAPQTSAPQNNLINKLVESTQDLLPACCCSRAPHAETHLRHEMTFS